LTPFVKWAGGKGQLIDRIWERMPQEYGAYYEPFVGGGALLFAMQPEPNCVINDVKWITRYAARRFTFAIEKCIMT